MYIAFVQMYQTQPNYNIFRGYYMATVALPGISAR